MPTKYVSNRARVEAEIESAIVAELTATAVAYERIVQESFRTPKSGRLYGGVKALKRFARQTAAGGKISMKGLHRASAPGEAPAIETGALSKGVTHEITKLSRFYFAIGVGVSRESGRSDIASWLEFGTARIKPRPAWRPALEILRQSMNQIRGR